MPGFDGTGPRGIGPMTGGGRGFCSTGGFRGSRRPYGARRWSGYGSPFETATPRDQEVNFLREEVQSLSRALEEIHARLTELGEESK